MLAAGRLAEWLVPAVRRRNADYRAVFSGPVGERVLADLLDACGVARAPGSLDPQSLAFEAGKRRIALRVCSILNLTDEDMARRALERPYAEGEDE